MAPIWSVSGHAHIGTEPLFCSPAIFPISPLTLIRREAAINWQERTGTQEVLAGGDVLTGTQEVLAGRDVLTGRRCWQTGTYWQEYTDKMILEESSRQDNTDRKILAERR